ncbi:unnamed protein product [Sphagnum jensenii]|uniref:t-SNARE coiled-coil homology domain-containing protein n=1 Tax=Sphagnum jensenii TaxID=128206 RepID=A0ABP0VWM0_9BRYO
MSVIDILTRVDVLCKKYEKYDLDKQRGAADSMSGNDQFLRLYTVLEADIEAAIQKSQDAQSEKNRAVVATLNAEVRRSKSALQAEIPKLEKLAEKKVKDLSKEEMAARPDLVVALAQKIQDIPDGVTVGRRGGTWGAKAGASKPVEIKVDAMHPDDLMRPEHYEQTEESLGFKQEYEARRAKQDEGLDVIAAGLTTLKDMAGDINEELNKQMPLIDEVDTKVDKAAADLKNTNVKLKETLIKMRSNRNFCVDIILIVIILGIGGYLYTYISTPFTSPFI